MADSLTPILINGQEVARVRLAPPERADRREVNLGLGIVQLPSLLERFRPKEPMPPQARFLALVRAFGEAMNDGRRNQLDENELAKRYIQTYGPSAALLHQVRRAGGDIICDTCNLPYYRHKPERALLDANGVPYVNRLCNGDLVKL